MFCYLIHSVKMLPCNFEANLMLHLRVRYASFSLFPLVSSFSIDDFRAYTIIDFPNTVIHICSILDTWSVIPIMAICKGSNYNFHVQRHNIHFIALLILECMHYMKENL